MKTRATATAKNWTVVQSSLVLVFFFQFDELDLQTLIIVLQMVVKDLKLCKRYVECNKPLIFKD